MAKRRSPESLEQIKRLKTKTAACSQSNQGQKPQRFLRAVLQRKWSVKATGHAVFTPAVSAIRPSHNNGRMSATASPFSPAVLHLLGLASSLPLGVPPFAVRFISPLLLSSSFPSQKSSPCLAFSTGLTAPRRLVKNAASWSCWCVLSSHPSISAPNTALLMSSVSLHSLPRARASPLPVPAQRQDRVRHFTLTIFSARHLSVVNRRSVFRGGTKHWNLRGWVNGMHRRKGKQSAQKEGGSS